MQLGIDKKHGTTNGVEARHRPLRSQVLEIHVPGVAVVSLDAQLLRVFGRHGSLCDTSVVRADSVQGRIVAW